MKLLKLTGGLTSLFFLTLIFNIYRFGYGFNDGFWRTLMTPFEGTVWSQRFTEESFDKIKLGMNSEEVYKILGDPLRKDEACDDLCFWIYTWQETGTADFDQRWIVFDKNKRVTEVRKSFFID